MWCICTDGGRCVVGWCLDSPCSGSITGSLRLSKGNWEIHKWTGVLVKNYEGYRNSFSSNFRLRIKRIFKEKVTEDNTGVFYRYLKQISWRYKDIPHKRSKISYLCSPLMPPVWTFLKILILPAINCCVMPHHRPSPRISHTASHFAWLPVYSHTQHKVLRATCWLVFSLFCCRWMLYLVRLRPPQQIGPGLPRSSRGEVTNIHASLDSVIIHSS